MSKMNWEHRKKMEKVWYAPASPSGGRRKTKSRKQAKGYDQNKRHVQMASKYEGQCRECTRRVQVGDIIWWSTKDKYVVHSYCFEVFMSDV